MAKGDQHRRFWVKLNYCTFYMESKDDIITEAPAVEDWLIGKTLQEVKPWFKKKKAVIKEVKVDETEK